MVSGITPEQERRWEAAPVVIAVGAAIAMAAAGWLLPRRALSRPPAAHLRARAPAQ